MAPPPAPSPGSCSNSTADGHLPGEGRLIKGGRGGRRGARDGNVTVPPQMVERGMSIHFPASTCRQPLRGRCPLSGVTPAALSGGRFPTSTARITAAAAVEGRGGKCAHQKPRALSGGRFLTSMAETPLRPQSKGAHSPTSSTRLRVCSLTRLPRWLILRIEQPARGARRAGLRGGRG